MTRIPLLVTLSDLIWNEWKIIVSLAPSPPVCSTMILISALSDILVIWTSGMLQTLCSKVLTNTLTVVQEHRSEPPPAPDSTPKKIVSNLLWDNRSHEMQRLEEELMTTRVKEIEAITELKELRLKVGHILLLCVMYRYIKPFWYTNQAMWIIWYDFFD